MTATRFVVLGMAVLAAGACSVQPTRAPVSERAAPRAAAPAPKPVPGVPAAPEGFYVVKRGETLYSIALDHGADYRDVAQWNFLEDPTKIQAGQLLRVKPPEGRAVEVGRASIAGRIESRPIESRTIESAPQQRQADGSMKTGPKALRLPWSKENAALLSREPAKPENQGVEFIWPAKGKVLTGFSEPRSKGIDIDGKIGDPVVAAAAGRVTYSGTGIPGLGKLVVIKHDNGFITVYAHNKDVLVKEQQNVVRGQKIAELGSTDADRPKLHFQIRRGSAPVDPLRYLPGL
jgi:lipoprotein NlpD